jgi:hypothetical protein
MRSFTWLVSAGSVLVNVKVFRGGRAERDGAELECLWPTAP